MEELSFSYNVKTEIIQKINTRQKADACLTGMLCCCNSLSDEHILFLTENKQCADFFVNNISRLLNCENAAKVYEADRKNGVVLYSIEICGEDCGRLLGLLGIDPIKKLDMQRLPKKKYYPQLIAGIFLACGSVNNPEKKYHMEFVMPALDMCNDLGLLLIDSYGIVPKHVERKNAQIVYLKESENIIDMLTLMGASMSSMELMNVKMFKDMRNKINRAVNCDNANIEKSLRAAEKQIADIEIIDSTMGIGSLPENLKEIARIRYDNPDFNLKELGAALDPPISRSGANHRLQKLAEIADRIRREKGMETANKELKEE